VGKTSRTKPSRKDRKNTRERRDRAVEHGLPASAVAGSRRVTRASPVDEFDVSDSLSSSSVDSGSRRSGAPAIDSGPSLLQRVKAIPWQVQLLVLGILVLVGAGLYRRYSQEQSFEGAVEIESPSGTLPAATVAVPDVVAQPEPKIPVTGSVAHEMAQAGDQSSGSTDTKKTLAVPSQSETVPRVLAAQKRAAQKVAKDQGSVLPTVELSNTVGSATPMTKSNSGVKAVAAPADNPY